MDTPKARYQTPAPPSPRRRSEASKPIGKNDSPMEFLKQAMSELGLLPEDISESSKGTSAAKQVLRSMTAAVHGLAELRHLYGDSHGKESSFKGLEPRHARLMVGVSESLSIFLLEMKLKNKN